RRTFAGLPALPFWKKRASGASVPLPQAGQLPGPSSKHASQSRQIARRRNGKWSRGALRAGWAVFTIRVECEHDAKPDDRPVAISREIRVGLVPSRATPAWIGDKLARRRICVPWIA